MEHFNTPKYSLSITMAESSEDFICSVVEKIMQHLEAIGFEQAFIVEMIEHDLTNRQETWRATFKSAEEKGDGEFDWRDYSTVWHYEAYNLNNSRKNYKGFFKVTVKMAGVSAQFDDGLSINPLAEVITALAYHSYVTQIVEYYPFWRTNYSDAPVLAEPYMAKIKPESAVD